MKYNEQMKNTVKRVEVHLREVLKMMEVDTECKNVVKQLSGAATTIDHTITVMASSNLAKCVQKAGQHKSNNIEGLVREAVDLLVKSR